MRLLKPNILYLFLIFSVLSSATYSQSMNDFEKALKKAKKNPEKKKNEEVLNATYLSIQSQNVQSLTNSLTESENLNNKLSKDIKEYAELKTSYQEVYTNPPETEGEATLELLLEQLVHDYYQQAEQLLKTDNKENYIKAIAYLEVVKTIDPNYRSVIELYNQASKNSTYDILIAYDMGNFPEHERAMQEVLNDINMKINAYNTDKKTFHFRREAGKEYQMIYLITFRHLDFGQITRKRDTQDYQRTVDGQIKRARVTVEQFSRNTKASGVFYIENQITNEEIERDPFNFNFTSRANNAKIEGDQEALDIRLMRELMSMRGSEFDVEQQGMETFKRRMFELLERHLRYDYPLGDL